MSANETLSPHNDPTITPSLTLPSAALVVAPAVVTVASPGSVSAAASHPSHAAHTVALLHLDLVLAQRLLHVHALTLQLDVLVHWKGKQC